MHFGTWLHLTNFYSFRALLPAASESVSDSDCEEHSIHGGSNVDEEPSTLAVIKQDSSRLGMEIESDDDEKWRVPWSEEELKHLAITMEDFEVSTPSYMNLLFSVCKEKSRCSGFSAKESASPTSSYRSGFSLPHG